MSKPRVIVDCDAIGSGMCCRALDGTARCGEPAVWRIDILHVGGDVYGRHLRCDACLLREGHPFSTIVTEAA